MSFWKRIFGGGAPKQTGLEPKGEDHAVLLHIRLGNDEFGEPGEVETMHDLEAELERAIAQHSAGELDGDEFGGGECVIFMYGPDAECLWSAIAPVLERHPFRKGSRAVKRFGAAGIGREETVNLHWDG